MSRLLIIRFSSLGDVAMTVPVIKALADQHQELEVSVLTRRRFEPLFSWMPDNVRTIGVELDEYHGLTGLIRLYDELKSHDFDMVADIHDVLRTKVLRTFFRLHGCKVAVIDKGRDDKRRIIGHGIDGSQLRTMTERYHDVFGLLGFPVTLTSGIHRPEKGVKRIGIAPFAAFETKMYPLDRMRKVAETLADRGVEVFLFGGGREESAILESWERDGIVSVCGKLGGLREELEFIKGLSLMVSMDSGNLHLATMMGVRTVSIWGATHPKAGFAPEGTIVIQKEMACRPCSIYGNKPCKYGDLRCMDIVTDCIVESIMENMT